MMKSLVWTIVLWALCLDALGQTADKEGFVLVRNEPPIEMHERWVPFPGKTPEIISRELKTKFVVHTSIQKVLNIIRDESVIQTWQPHVSQFRIFLRTDSTVWDEYSRHDLPWPVSDQDSFMEYHLTELNPGVEYLVMFKSRLDAHLAPIQKDANRIELHGSWHIVQISADEVKVTYRVQSVPGAIPRMIADPVIRGNLVSSMKALSELLQK